MGDTPTKGDCPLGNPLFRPSWRPIALYGLLQITTFLWVGIGMPPAILGATSLPEVFPD
jgi:hypothetical protein